MAIKEQSPASTGTATRPRRTYPVQWWAVVGAGVLLVQAVVLYRWFGTG